MNEISSLPSLSDLLTQNSNLQANKQLDRFAQNEWIGSRLWCERSRSFLTVLILFQLTKLPQPIELLRPVSLKCLKTLLKGLIKRRKISARKETQDLILGKSDNIHEAVVKSQEAGVAFNLMIEVRNKLVESYKELMRMQV